MPRGDGTGPLGMGPMTGRGAGSCSWFGEPVYGNTPPAYGSGMSYGRGRGRRFWGALRWCRRFFVPGSRGGMGPSGYVAPYQRPDPELEKQMLKNEADALQSELNLIRKRMDELESEKAGE